MLEVDYNMIVYNDSAEEVTHAIKKLDVNKARGSDGVYSEHIKYASNILVPLLSMCFTSCMGFCLIQWCQLYLYQLLMIKLVKFHLKTITMLLH